jgi:hypothetical protein
MGAGGPRRIAKPSRLGCTAQRKANEGGMVRVIGGDGDEYEPVSAEQLRQ